jgi:hypothetical protein
MGGTSFDITLTKDGQNHVRQPFANDLRSSLLRSSTRTARRRKGPACGADAGPELIA